MKIKLLIILERASLGRRETVCCRRCGLITTELSLGGRNIMSNHSPSLSGIFSSPSFVLPSFSPSQVATRPENHLNTFPRTSKPVHSCWTETKNGHKTQQSQKRYMVSGSLSPLISFLDVSYSVSFVVRGQRPCKGWWLMVRDANSGVGLVPNLYASSI